MYASNLSNEETEALARLKYELANADHKLKLAYITLKCLNLTDKYPRLAPYLGLIWLTDDSFLCHAAKMCAFFGMKPNSVSHNYISNCFISRKSSAEIRAKIPKKYDVTKFAELRMWYLRHSPYFTKQTTEEEALHWNHRQDKTKTEKKQKNTKNKMLSFPENDNNLFPLPKFNLDFPTQNEINSSISSNSCNNQNDENNYQLFMVDNQNHAYSSSSFLNNDQNHLNDFDDNDDLFNLNDEYFNDDQASYNMDDSSSVDDKSFYNYFL